MNGRILVRPANNNVQPGAEGTVGDARVSLAADQSHIRTAQSNFSIMDGQILLNAASGGFLHLNSAHTTITGNRFDATTTSGIGLQANNGGININAVQDNININADSGRLDIKGNTYATMEGVGGVQVWASGANARALFGSMSGTTILDGRHTNVTGTDYTYISGGGSSSANFTANTIDLNTSNSLLSLNGGWGNYGIFGMAMGAGNQGSMYYYANNKYKVSVADDGENGDSYLKMEDGNIMLGTYHSAGYASMFDGRYRERYQAGLNLHYDTLELNSETYGGMNITDSKTSFWRRDEGVYDRTDFRHTSYINMTGNSITQSLIANRSGSDKSYAGTNLSNNAFRLYVGRSFYANGVANNAALSLFNLNSSTAEIIVSNAKMKLDSSIAQFEIGSSNMHLNSEGLFLYKKYANEQIPAISLNATSGRIDGGYFTVNKIYNPYNNGGRGYWQNPIINWRKMSTYDNGFATNDPLALVNLNQTGFTNKGMVRMNTSSANVNGAYDATAGQDKFLFNTNSSKSYVNNFRVDPAFVSVMNDIRLTSRGGAKLSHALPNYILKGIYILTNSYTDGGWPCGDGPSTCSYNMPYFTAEELGLGRGGYEFHCTGDDVGGSNPVHPMMGKCVDHVTASQKYVEFSYPKNDNYKEYRETCGRTDDACWAHPFMGVVPVPGREITIKLTTGDETLYAHDEGECPDGYMPVMTVTPTIFELGRVNAIKRSIAAAGQVYLSNPGYQNFVNNETYKFVNIYQMGTKLGIVTKPICDYDSVSNTGDLRHATCKSGNRTLKGWAIAMGTVTQDNVHPGNYIWNVGGVYTNSWQATAHTYCYFNPARFIMPNMTSYGSNSRTQTSQENPILNSSKRGLMMDEYD